MSFLAGVSARARGAFECAVWRLKFTYGGEILQRFSRLDLHKSK